MIILPGSVGDYTTQFKTIMINSFFSPISAFQKADSWDSSATHGWHLIGVDPLGSAKVANLQGNVEMTMTSG